MSWNQVTIDVPDDLIDAVVGELSVEGVTGVWESHAPEPGKTRLVLYFHFRSDLRKVETILRSVFERSGRQNPPISRSIVEEHDNAARNRWVLPAAALKNGTEDSFER